MLRKHECHRTHTHTHTRFPACKHANDASAPFTLYDKTCRHVNMSVWMGEGYLSYTYCPTIYVVVSCCFVRDHARGMCILMCSVTALHPQSLASHFFSSLSVISRQLAYLLLWGSISFSTSQQIPLHHSLPLVPGRSGELRRGFERMCLCWTVEVMQNLSHGSFLCFRSTQPASQRSPLNW